MEKALTGSKGELAGKGGVESRERLEPGLESCEAPYVISSFLRVSSSTDDFCLDFDLQGRIWKTHRSQIYYMTDFTCMLRRQAELVELECPFLSFCCRWDLGLLGAHSRWILKVEG